MSKRIEKIALYCFLFVTSIMVALFVSCAEKQPDEPSSIVTNVDEVSLSVGKNFTVLVEDGNLFRELHYESLDSSVAVVSNNGIITAISAGKTSVKISTTTLECNVSVIVTEKIVKEVALSMNYIDLGVGAKTTLSATVFVNGVESGETLIWSTQDETGVLSFVTQGNTIVLTAEKAGSAMVIASAGETKAVCAVNVLSSADPRDYEAVQTPIVDSDTNYALSEGVEFWSDEGKTSVYDGGIKFYPYLNGKRNSLSLASDLIKAAVKKYLYMDVRIVSASSSPQIRLYKDETYEQEINADENNIFSVRKETVLLDDLKGDDGEYKFFITDEGATADDEVVVKFLSFHGINYATKEYEDCWISDAALSYDQRGVVVPHKTGVKLTFSSEKIGEMVADGYTRVSMTLSNSGFDFWLTIKGGNDIALQSGAKVTSPFTKTVDLSALKNDDGTYSLIFSTAGWWAGQAFYVNSLTFIKPIDVLTEAKDALDVNGATNFAGDEKLLDLFTSTSQAISYDGGIKIQQQAGQKPTFFDTRLIEYAVSKGYTKISVTILPNQNFSVDGGSLWTIVKGGALNSDGAPTTTIISTKEKTEITKEINIESALELTEATTLGANEGIYSLGFSVVGGWSGVYPSFYFTITSLTFCA